MKKLKRVAIWAVTNGTWYLLAALGTVTNLGWAWNIFVFMTWLLTLCAGFMFAGMLASEATKKPLDFPSPPVPLWIDITLDVALAILVVGFGHWFYGLMLVSQLAAYTYCYTRPKQVAPPVAP